MELERLLEEDGKTLPEEDLRNPALLESCARSALKAREEFPWCAALSREDFLRWAAYPRVNDEELADCRALFREELAPRVRGLSWERAVLEVNRWCAQHVTYRYNDDPTASPLRVYRRGYGRCGEESVFAVNALRSVGIAARQVYAPWWSHCDDNHAWVEVFDGKDWRYLGACEPEPVLDRGWFTAAASRAMMVRAKVFDRAAPGGVRFLPVTERYARTRLVTVTVLRENGQPAAGVGVRFSVLNMAGFREIASGITDRDGRVVQRFGLGSLRVSAADGNRLGEALLDVRQEDAARLVLQAVPQETKGFSYDFYAPAGSPDPSPPLTWAQAALRREWLAEAAALRQRHAVPEPEGGAVQGKAPSQPGDAILFLRAPADRAARSGVDYTLSRWEQGRWEISDLPEVPAGGERTVPLLSGTYRAVTVTRLPGGDQLVWERILTLSPGERRWMELEFRPAPSERLLDCRALPPFSLENRAGKVESAALLGQRSVTLLVWLEPGREPTEHLLNELADAAPALKELDCAVHLAAEDPAQAERDPALRKLRAALPEAVLWTGNFQESVEPLARQTFQDPDKLPFVLLADQAGNGRYACGGYGVGMGDLLVRLAGALHP